MGVRDFVITTFQKSGRIIVDAKTIRDTGLYFEVETSGITSDMEDWIINYSDDDAYYYCDDQATVFGKSKPDRKVFWFFDSSETATMFKLAFG